MVEDMGNTFLFEAGNLKFLWCLERLDFDAFYLVILCNAVSGRDASSRDER